MALVFPPGKYRKERKKDYLPMPGQIPPLLG
jgi:hypothetical protein